MFVYIARRFELRTCNANYTCHKTQFRLLLVCQKEEDEKKKNEPKIMNFITSDSHTHTQSMVVWVFFVKFSNSTEDLLNFEFFRTIYNLFFKKNNGNVAQTHDLIKDDTKQIKKKNVLKKENKIMPFIGKLIKCAFHLPIK